MLLCCQAAFTPFVLAKTCPGYGSSFWFTFVGTFLFWFLGGVCDTLDNPFQKDFTTLNLTRIHNELNEGLADLLVTGKQQAPTVQLVSKCVNQNKKQPKRRQSMNTIRQTNS